MVRTRTRATARAYPARPGTEPGSSHLAQSMPSSSRAAPVGAAPMLWVLAYTAFLAAAGTAIAILATGDPANPLDGAWLSALALTITLIAAGFLQLELWYGQEGESFDLFEAVLAPVIFALPPLGVVAVVAVAKTVAEILLRRHPVKATFNVAQWIFATAVGAVVFAGLRPDTATPRDLPALVAALLTISLLNHVALIGVFWLDQRQPLRQVLAATGSAPSSAGSWPGSTSPSACCSWPPTYGCP